MKSGKEAWSDGAGWGFAPDDDYGAVFFKRAVGELPEMECSKAIARRLKSHILPHDSILDVGCGAGHYLRSLEREIRVPFTYAGTDLTAKYIALAREAFRDRKNVSFQVANIFDLPFADQSFDIVMSSNVFLHLRAVAPPLRELCRIAKRSVLIRTLIGERSFLIQEVREEGDEFDEDGNPRAFNYYNIYSRRYFEHLLQSIPRVKAYDFMPDRDFDPERIVKSVDDHKNARNATRICGGWQINHYILQPWCFLEIELDA